MENQIKVFKQYYDEKLLMAWIKFLRLEQNLSQEELAYGICSASYLSYFESGKKTLSGEWIELLLSKLKVSKLNNNLDQGILRSQYFELCQALESSRNDEGSRNDVVDRIMDRIKTYESVLKDSPFYIEYRVYDYLYRCQRRGLEDKEALLAETRNLDRIKDQLEEELQYYYYLASGRFIYKFVDHDDGIDRLEKAFHIRPSAWIHFSLGFSYCFHRAPLKAVYHFEEALRLYERSGGYINAVWCHNYLGICYTKLEIYNKAYGHYQTALKGAEHFGIHTLDYHLHVNLSDYYLNIKIYDKCIEYAKMAMQQKSDAILPAVNITEAAYHLGDIDTCTEYFDKYLQPQYSVSYYYMLLKFLHLYYMDRDNPNLYSFTLEEVIPYYEKLKYTNLITEIEIKLAEYLESKRRYKEACQIYKKYIDPNKFN